jgi:hypothetical protein
MVAMSIKKCCLTMEETLAMEEILHDKGNLEKLKGRRKGLAFYTSANKLKP